jgi:hypothetical protein
MSKIHRDLLVQSKSRLIIQGRLHLNTARHEDAVEMLLQAAEIEDLLAEDAGTDPNGPRREDHLRSAASCRALAKKKGKEGDA